MSGRVKAAPRRDKLGLAAAVAVVATAIFAAPAGAYVYWANSEIGGIARGNLDGTGRDWGFIGGATDPHGVAVNARHVYWTNSTKHTIGRARLDGTHVKQRFIKAASFAAGVAVGRGHIYWTNAADGTIGRAKLDGTRVNQRFITGASGLGGIAVGSGHVYWANGSVHGSIGRAKLDGTRIDQKFISGLYFPGAVAVGAGRLYWTTFDGRKIGRANLDGTGVRRNFITRAHQPLGIAVDSHYIYWAWWGVADSNIARARLDGTRIRQKFQRAFSPYGVAVDSLKPPETEIVSARIDSADRKAVFRFSSSQRRSSFRCRLDGERFRDCNSPKVYRHLTRGRHVFRVKARNSQRAFDPLPARRRFTI
jgi:hypothetical protein